MSTMRVSSSSLAATYLYRDMVAAPSSAATRAIERAPIPSVRATLMPAATTRSRLRPLRVPRPGRSRRPQASSITGGNTGFPPTSPFPWLTSHHPCRKRPA